MPIVKQIKPSGSNVSEMISYVQLKVQEKISTQ
jgi:hypothetical protein